MNRSTTLRQLLRENRFLVVLGSISVTIRLIVVTNGGRSLFDSGQDAPTYLDAALDFASYGWFSNQISSLPVWPAGYPFFLSVILTIGGSSGWMLVSLFQHLLFLIGVTYFIHEMRGYFSNEQRRVLSIILFLMPSFIYSASENMYEALLTSLLLIGIAASLHILQADSIERLPLVIAITSFGFSGFLQAKTAPIGVLVFLIISFRRKNKLFLFVPLTLWGVALTIHRSFVAYGIYSPSINFSIALNVSGAKVPCILDSPANLSPVKLGASVDRQYIECAVRHFAAHPTELITHMSTQARALFGPLDGAGISGATTWFHGLGFQRIIGFFGFSNQSAIFRIENIYALLLNLFMFVGFVLALRTLNRVKTILISMPVVIISMVHLISDGDARYRLPFLPFQLVFLVVFLTYAKSWALRRLQSRT